MEEKTVKVVIALVLVLTLVVTASGWLISESIAKSQQPAGYEGMGVSVAFAVARSPDVDVSFEINRDNQGGAE